MVKGSISKKTQERDERIYQFLLKEVRRSGVFPTVRGIMEALGLSSPSMVESALLRLEAKGFLQKQGRKRSLSGFSAGIPVPVLGTIAAGTPLMAAEHIDGYVHLPAHLAREKELFALRVRGESMINAGILEGEIVVLEKASTVDNGEIAAVWLEDAATVKRVYRENGRIRLQPENDGMSPIYTDRCEILGRVVTLIRDYESY